jgi:hypothetical protein
MIMHLLAVKLKQGPGAACPDDGLPYNEGFGASQAIRYLKMAERGSRRGYHFWEKVFICGEQNYTKKTEVN